VQGYMPSPTHRTQNWIASAEYLKAYSWLQIRSFNFVFLNLTI
jgi:hypothetical protein